MRLFFLFRCLSVGLCALSTRMEQFGVLYVHRPPSLWRSSCPDPATRYQLGSDPEPPLRHVLRRLPNGRRVERIRLEEVKHKIYKYVLNLFDRTEDSIIDGIELIFDRAGGLIEALRCFLRRRPGRYPVDQFRSL